MAVVTAPTRRSVRRVSAAAPYVSRTETLRLIVAHRYPLFAHAVQGSFEETEDFKVVALCEDGESTIRAVGLYRPDVVLVDIDIPGKDGLNVLREIKAMNMPTRVVLFTDELAERQAAQALRANVDGIVPKTAKAKTLIECVRKVTAGVQWIEQDVLRQLVDRLIVATPISHGEGCLTPAERKVLEFVAEGLVNKEIADRLQISEGTVKNHLHNVYVKLGISGRREVVRHARETGLLKQMA